MAQIRDKNIVPTKPVQVSPHVDLPPGISGTGYFIVDEATGEEVTDVFDNPYADIDVSDIVVDSSAATDSNNISLLPPGNIKIISQTVRFSPAGDHVIDLVIGFDDVQGAGSYGVRITKG